LGFEIWQGMFAPMLAFSFSFSFVPIVSWVGTLVVLKL
jgi:hypothetical protein